MKWKDLLVDQEDIKAVEELYNGAFPIEERIEFGYALAKAKQQLGKIFAIYDQDELVGMTYIVEYLDIAYLFYFAILPSKQNQGYGSLILKELQERYENIILNIEALDERASNNDERIRRKEFYLKNGFQDAKFKTLEAGVVYETMCYGRILTCKEYFSIVQNYFGMEIFKEYYQEYNS